jgi:hypothetical protein
VTYFRHGLLCFVASGTWSTMLAMSLQCLHGQYVSPFHQGACPCSIWLRVLPSVHVSALFLCFMHAFFLYKSTSICCLLLGIRVLCPVDESKLCFMMFLSRCLPGWAHFGPLNFEASKLPQTLVKTCSNSKIVFCVL